MGNYLESYVIYSYLILRIFCRNIISNEDLHKRTNPSQIQLSDLEKIAMHSLDYIVWMHSLEHACLLNGIYEQQRQKYSSTYV